MPLIYDGVDTDELCFCVDNVGGEGCENNRGIAGIYFQAPNQFLNVVLKATTNACCEEGVIESFSMLQAGATPAAGELLHKITYVPSDADESAILTETATTDGGTPSTQNEFAIQIRGNKANDTCWLRKNLNREVTFVVKMKDKRTLLVGYGGGIRLSGYTWDSTGYIVTATFSGTPINPYMEIDPTWADINIQPHNGGVGLIAA